MSETREGRRHDGADRRSRRVPRRVGLIATLVVVGLLGAWFAVTSGQALERGYVTLPPRSDVELAIVDEGDRGAELALVSVDRDRPPRVLWVQSVTNRLAVPVLLVAVEPGLGMACGPRLDGVGRAVRLAPDDGAVYELVDSARDLPLRLGPGDSAVVVLDLDVRCPDGAPMPGFSAGTYASTEGLRVRIRALGRPRTVRVATDHRLGWTTAGLETMSFDADATVRLVPPQLP